MDTAGLRQRLTSRVPKEPPIKDPEYTARVLPRATPAHVAHPPPQQEMYAERQHGSYTDSPASAPASVANPVSSDQDVITVAISPAAAMTAAAAAAALIGVAAVMLRWR